MIFCFIWLHHFSAAFVLEVAGFKHAEDCRNLPGNKKGWLCNMTVNPVNCNLVTKVHVNAINASGTDVAGMEA